MHARVPNYHPQTPFQTVSLRLWVNNVKGVRIHGMGQYVYLVQNKHARRSSLMMVKRYAQILGVVLILVGIVGLVLGDQVWLGILNVDIVEDIVHLLTGGLLAYVGFSQTDLSTARNVVLALGVIYLVVGILGFVVPMMFGLIPHGYTLFDDLLHLALGILSLAVAFGLGGAPARRRSA